MATCFHGAPELKPDGLQTLYLMNPGYVGYSDHAVAPAKMVLLNSTLNPMNSINAGHLIQQQHQQQHFARIPLQQQQQKHDSSCPPPTSAGVALHHNLWAPPTTSNSVGMVASSHLSGGGLHRSATTAAVPSARQGLSLSLSPHEMAPPAAASEVKMALAGASNGVSGLQGILSGSKYLKPTQQLLDEVVSVGKGIKDDPAKGANSKKPAADGSEAEFKGTAGAADDSSSKRGTDLTTAERQELQMKKAKLVNMLDEVEQRYRQYHHQMQIVISSFEAVAGYGSAKTYSALALRTISKQFRCLRDAITGEIRETSKSLGGEDIKSGGSRLRFINHHLRQQRALQQLGMIQQNAWRPQRGLPERSVSILRAWLIEHFLHPYPKDSDKVMLAKQTGLTRSQVSNWFINARVRLWKPMVEEMYTEETKDQEHNTAGEDVSKSDANGSSSSKSTAQQESSPTAVPATLGLKNDQQHTSPVATQSSPITSTTQNQAHCDKNAIVQPTMKMARSNDSLHVNAVPHSMGMEMKLDELNNQELLMKFMDGRQRFAEQGYTLFTGGNTSYGGSNYGAYEVGRFDSEQFNQGFSSNGVSLTLGLRHSENLPFSRAQLSFLSGESMQLGRRLEMNTETSDYCNLHNSTGTNNAVAISSNAAAFRNERDFQLNYYQTT